MSEEESAKAKQEQGRSPAAPVAKVTPTPARVAPVVTPVRARPLVAPGAPQAPAALRSPAVAPSAPVSPKPPAVAASAEALAATEMAGTPARAALEATIFELTGWRREAEKRIAQLEAEVLRLRTTNRVAGPPTGSDIHREQTGALFPAFDASPAPPAAAQWPPAPQASLVPTVTGLPPVQPSPVIVRAPSAPELLEAQSIAPSILPSVSIAPSITPVLHRPAPKPQYDLEMKPGEYFDLPAELNGGKKKKFLVGLLLFIILGGMSVLIITALASQR